MIRINKHYIGIMIMGLGLYFAPAAIMTTSAKQAPQVFNVVDTIDSVDTVRSTATVGGKTFPLLPTTIAYDKNGNKMSLRRLVNGTRVGLELKKVNDKMYIAVFWVVGKNSVGLPGAG